MEFSKLFHLAKRNYGVNALALTAFCSFYAPSLHAQDTNDDIVLAPFEKVDINIFGDLRLRYHSLTQDNLPDNSDAFTVRLKSGIEFEFSDILTALIEVEASESLNDNFDNTLNNEINRPTIPDVNTVELNRFQLQSEISKVRVTLGRQELALDNWRFLGNWQFRQNDQTLDALRLEAPLAGGRFNAAYFNAVQRHFGQDSPVGEFTGDSYILNYNRPLLLGQLSLFHYALDLQTGPDDAVTDTFSTVTSGARLHGRQHWGDYGLAWDFSLARQSDFADNPNDFDALYGEVSLSLQYKNIEVSGSLEHLGQNNGTSVQTPLASLHDFQGVTDRFFVTPPDGLRDFNAGLTYDLGDWGKLEHIELKAGYHKFTSDAARRDYGREINLGLSAKIDHVTFFFQYGDYNSLALETDVGLFANDARALLFSTSYSFD